MEGGHNNSGVICSGAGDGACACGLGRRSRGGDCETRRTGLCRVCNSDQRKTTNRIPYTVNHSVQP